MTQLIRNSFDTEKKVVAFLQDVLEVSAGKVMPWSRIGQDLGVDGEDAEELLSLFSSHFNVDISGFHIGDYFGAEAGINPPLAFMLRIFGNARPHKTLKVSDLVEAVKKGRLV